MDSMAIYRRMDIGTAKPLTAERAAIPHHLIDIVEPWQDFSLADYVNAAEQSATETLSRGRNPIFVGGTPLYLKALLRGMFAGPPADWEFRQRVSAEAAQHDPEWLHAQVRTIDPKSASRLHPQDTKRLVRVLEVYEKTGQPISQLQREFDNARPADECRVFVLDWPRDVLYERINARVEAMFAAGLVEEVHALLAEQRSVDQPPVTVSERERQGDTSSSGSDGNPLSRTARQALGYREVIDHLAGGPPLAETILLVKNRTRAFARRQLTWFRSLSECRMVACTDEMTAEQLAAQIARG